MSNEDNNQSNNSEANQRPMGGGMRGPRPGGPRPGGSGGDNDSGGGSFDGQGRSGGFDGPNRSGPGGAGGPGGARRPRRPGGKDRFAPRRKVCQFCVDKVRLVDYKDFQRLRRYLSDRGKIEPRRKTGTCARHQRSLTTAIKRGRYLALLPYVASQNR